MSTAVATKATPAVEEERRFLLPGIGWAGYEALLALIGDGPVRVTYHKGSAELMSPLRRHERWRKQLGYMVETIAQELGIDCEPAGGPTLRREDRDAGLEPDECYYLASVDRLRADARDFDLTLEPPPDLAIEIELTRSAIPRLPIYADLGVPEVWRHAAQGLVLLIRQPDGNYVASPVSLAFPFVSLTDLDTWMERARTNPKTMEWRRAFQAWVRDELGPRVRDRQADEPQL